MKRRSALITGASAGIGLSIASMLIEHDWDVTIVARDEARLRRATGLLDGGGARVHAIAANLALDVAEQVVDDHLEAHGGLDLLVNNAGVGVVGPLEDKAAKTLDLEIALNLRGTYRMTQVAVPALRESARTHGASYVANVSSMTARETPPNASAYAATKAALVALSHSAHAELSEQGIHVTALLPGFVDTPGTQWARSDSRERMILPSDVAEAVLFILRTSASCFVPEILLTSSGPGLSSLVDWESFA